MQPPLASAEVNLAEGWDTVLEVVSDLLELNPHVTREQLSKIKPGESPDELENWDLSELELVALPESIHQLPLKQLALGRPFKDHAASLGRLVHKLSSHEGSPGPSTDPRLMHKLATPGTYRVLGNCFEAAGRFEGMLGEEEYVWSSISNLNPERQLLQIPNGS